MGENGQNDNTKNTETGTSSAKNQQTQSQQTTTNRFADYFVICGLDLDTGLEPDRFAGMYCNAHTFNTIYSHSIPFKSMYRCTLKLDKVVVDFSQKTTTTVFVRTVRYFMAFRF